ncbi:hypothetical protein MCETE7_01574 [Acidimicrobiia bacterium]
MELAGVQIRGQKARLGSKAAAIAVLTLALLSAGCSAVPRQATTDDSELVAPDIAMSSVPSSVPIAVVAGAPVVDVAPEIAISRAVDAFWLAYLAAHDPPNPDHLSLADVAIGEELALLRERISMRRMIGESIRRSKQDAFMSTARIRSLAAESAVVDVCVFDDLVVVDILSGKVVNDKVGTYRFEMSMVKQNSRWLVGMNRILSHRAGVDECER